MQTFLPYPDFIQSAKVLDNKRLGKQRIEAKQILEINLLRQKADTQGFLWSNEIHYNPNGSNVIVKLLVNERVNQVKIPWENHPAVLMWRGYEFALAEYGIAICKEWIFRGFRDNQLDFFEDNCLENDEDYEIKYPEWLGNPKFHLSHQSNLLRKDWDYYSKYFIFTKDLNLPYYWPVRK